MSGNSGQTFRIGVIAERNRSYGRRICEGVASHALERGGWILEMLDDGSLERIPSCDAYIARVVNRGILAALKRTKRPVVDVYGAFQSAGVVRVDCDHESVGRMAAEYFLGHRFANFAYCGYDGSPFSDSRFKAFSNRLAAEGCGCIGYDTPKSAVDDFGSRILRREMLDRAKDAAQLRAFAKSLPSRVAVFCSHDLRAYHFAKAVAETGRSVPDDVAILGCDNDALVCAFSPIPLSSIDPDAFEVGRKAAEAVDKLLSGEKSGPVLVQPKGVVERASTEVYPLDPPWISDALVFIRRNFRRNISASDVYSHVGLSHTPIDKAFKEVLGSSVHKEIMRAKLAEAARMLSSGEASVGVVSKKCGFPSQEHFWYAFKRRFGVSPSEYAESGG